MGEARGRKINQNEYNLWVCEPWVVEHIEPTDVEMTSSLRLTTTDEVSEATAMLTSWLTDAIKLACATEAASSSPDIASDETSGRLGPLSPASKGSSFAFDEDVLQACVEEALDDLLPTFLSLTATLIMFEECHIQEGKGGKLRLTPELCVRVLESVPVSLLQPVVRGSVQGAVFIGSLSIPPRPPPPPPRAPPPSLSLTVPSRSRPPGVACSLLLPSAPGLGGTRRSKSTIT